MEPEAYVIKSMLKDIPLVKTEAMTPAQAKEYETVITNTLATFPPTTIEGLYQGFLGYHAQNVNRMKITKAELVKLANYWVCDVLHYGETPPAISRDLVGKMGFKGVPGILISQSSKGPNRRERRQGINVAYE